MNSMKMRAREPIQIISYGFVKKSLKKVIEKYVTDIYSPIFSILLRQVIMFSIPADKMLSTLLEIKKALTTNSIYFI